MKTGVTSYLLRSIPVDLWAKVSQKALASNPPVSIRWVILKLLREWVAKV